MLDRARSYVPQSCWRNCCILPRGVSKILSSHNANLRVGVCNGGGLGCGIGAMFIANMIQSWYLPQISSTVIAAILVLLAFLCSLCRLKTIGRLIFPIVLAAFTLALLSCFIPIISGTVDWQTATDFHLNIPFDGVFGSLTSFMAGFLLVNLTIPSYEKFFCFANYSENPEKDIPRAVVVMCIITGIYFILIPIVWLGSVGEIALTKNISLSLMPVFSPLFGSFAKAMSFAFLILMFLVSCLTVTMFASRVLFQLSKDGLPLCVFHGSSQKHKYLGLRLVFVYLLVFYLCLYTKNIFGLLIQWLMQIF